MLPWASILGPSTTLPPLPEFWPLYARRFRSVSRWLARALFASVRLHGAAGTRAADHGPVVVYSNHPSFWDPVILGLATERLWPERAILAAIEPGALEQHRYFQGLGFFPLSPTAAGFRRLATICQGLREQPGCCLVVTPEGRFTPPGESPALRRGLALALARWGQPDWQLVPLALRYELGAQPRPRVDVAWGEPRLLGDLPSPEPAALHHLLTNSLLGTMAELDRARAHDAPGITLLEAPC